MTVPYQPEPGCSAVQAQQARQIHDLRQQLKSAEDELGRRRRTADDDNRRAELAEQKARALAATLDEVLGTFIHKVHPGFSGLQSAMVRVYEVEEWRAVLRDSRPAPARAIAKAEP